MIQEESSFSRSRRRFLVGLGASLALPLLPGCGLIDKLEDQNCGALDCASQPALEVDNDFRDRVERAAVFIRRLMHPDDRDFPIIYQKSGGLHSGGLTQPGNTPLYSGPLVVRLFLPDATEGSAQLAERMIVHEAVHAYDISSGYKLSNYLDWEIVGALAQEEFNVLDESSHTNNPFQSNHGHPDVGAAELLASTINVMKSYPESFLEQIRELPEQSIIKVSKIASVCLSGLIIYAYESTRPEDLQIDPAILELISEYNPL